MGNYRLIVEVYPWIGKSDKAEFSFYSEAMAYAEAALHRRETHKVIVRDVAGGVNTPVWTKWKVS